MKPAILVLLAAFANNGQQATPPKYEVASIRPSTDAGFDYAFDIGPDGSLTAAGITLKRLMMTAYNVQGFRIRGGPEWVGSKRWTIQARPDRPAAPGQVRAMLRALLDERFLLHTRAEVRELPVYELAADRKGPKVSAAKEGKPRIRVGPGLIELTNAMPGTFASQLSYAMGQPVVDRTGLSGSFDFLLQWTPEPRESGGPETEGLPPGTPEPPSSNRDGPSIFTAVREQLGLALRSARGPVEVVVIEGAQLPKPD